MSVYLSHRLLKTWSGPDALAEGRQIVARDGVQGLDIAGDWVHATVTAGERPVFTRFRILDDGSVESHCPCRMAQDRGVICPHVIAAGYKVVELTEDPVLERRHRIEVRRRTHGVKGASPRLPLRVPAGSANSVSAQLRIRLPEQWLSELRKGEVTITCHAYFRDSKRRLDKLSSSDRLAFNEKDSLLLDVLDDLAGAAMAPGSLTLSLELFLELLREVAPGELAVLGRADPIRVSDDPLLSSLTVRLDPADGTLMVSHHVEDGGAEFLVGRRQAWVLSGDALHPLETRLPADLDAAYRGAARIPRSRTLSFLRRELPALEDRVLVDCDVRPDSFVVKQGTPAFEVELQGDLTRLSVGLWACYAETRLRVSSTGTTEEVDIPVPGEWLSYWTRNRAAEAEALQWLRSLGSCEGEGGLTESLCDAAQILRFLAETVPAIRFHGWRVTFGPGLEGFEGRARWVKSVVAITPSTEPGWFDLCTRYCDDQGRLLQSDAVEEALDDGRAVINMDGHPLLLNQPVLNALRSTLAECTDPASGGSTRVHAMHAGYLSGVLAGQEAVQVQAEDMWIRHAQRQVQKTNLEPVELPPELDSILRPYQKTGIYWLRFLERGGLSGILADEMGLGKTLQALAWLSLERESESARGLPSLIVCPTSLVQNWAREAARFTPSQRVLVIAGTQRHSQWDAIGSHNLVITSYGLLRRDLEQYRSQVFAAVVLDEAQHIKNRSTLNAVAAKQLKAAHRLVLTGTPVENGVADLWSIMDFLMPGYLGSHAVFTQVYERPIAGGEARAQPALVRLRQKVEPFILRRLKASVAHEIPQKVTRIATCTLLPEQASLYNEELEHYQTSLTQLVRAQGFSHARFAVFKALLRLRQICCHPALIRKPGIDASVPSGKCELFFELLDEALDGGHRVLVFSQFVQMLHLLRAELDRRDIAYCYLDGGTRDRMQTVDTFNNTPEIPVFLISLKAGGSGLNLTGANVVIHVDPWWNPAVEDQATDRTHRIGQTRTVYSIKLATEGTVEAKVLALQERKRGIIQATVGPESRFEQGLNWEDVQELLAH